MTAQLLLKIQNQVRVPQLTISSRCGGGAFPRLPYKNNFSHVIVEAAATVISPEEVEKLTKEMSELKSQHDGLLDKYRRSIAENDNMRKRLTKQIEDAKIFGIQGKQRIYAYSC